MSSTTLRAAAEGRARTAIALTMGDPGGVGPELTARLLHHVVSEASAPPDADLVLYASDREWERACDNAGSAVEHRGIEASPFVRRIDTGADPRPAPVGEATEASGSVALAGLDAALRGWEAGEVDALVFGPLNKAALHLAGMAEYDEMRWFEARLGSSSEVSELNVSAGLWTSRVTSHVAMREVADLITPQRVAAVSHLLARYLVGNGVPAPRIAVCAFNPHAGESGLFGTEEIDAIGPGIEIARGLGLDIEGPFPSDTLFVHARARGFDGVVTMYHDQGQIALKSMGFQGGVTVEGGLAIPICTPAHGTAYDIVGTGRADLTSTLNALGVARRLAASGLTAA